MIEESGEIISCEGDYAWVETRRKSACASCVANKGCGTGVLARLYGARFNRVRALNHIQALPGQQVVIGLAENALVRGSLVTYGMPLITMIIAALLGKAIASELSLQTADGMIALFGILGLAAGFYLLRLFSDRIAHDSDYQPVVLRSCDNPLEKRLEVEL